MADRPGTRSVGQCQFPPNRPRWWPRAVLAALLAAWWTAVIVTVGAGRFTVAVGAGAAVLVAAGAVVGAVGEPRRQGR